MTRRTRRTEDPTTTAAVDALVAGVESPAELEEVFRVLKQRMVERVLAAGLTEHLGYPPGEEEAAFWQRVLSELQGRGVADIAIALIDGLKGFPEAIHAGFGGTIGPAVS